MKGVGSGDILKKYWLIPREQLLCTEMTVIENVHEVSFLPNNYPFSKDRNLIKICIYFGEKDMQYFAKTAIVV